MNLFTYIKLATSFSLLSLLLTGCGSEDQADDMSYLCQPQPGLDVVCGFTAPEDMEWLPDGSGMIVSEYGHLGKFEGRLSLFEHEAGRITHLYDSKTNRALANKQLWGDPACEESDFFSPHGISLKQRPSGRWQLLVVNHGEIEVIDFFELKQTEDHWYLDWRGCVEADDNSLFNDVTAAPRGFYVTRFFEKGSVMNSVLDYYFKRKNGHVKRWTNDAGWQVLEGTEAVLPNGVLWNPEANELVVSEWGNATLNVYDGNGNKKHEIAMPFPDNVSWDENREAYLIPSKGGSFFSAASCSSTPENNCEAGFTVYEVTPGSSQAVERFYSDGSFFGAAANAVERDDKLYIGSFTGKRMLIAEQ